MRPLAPAAALVLSLSACAGPAPSGVADGWKFAGKAIVTDAPTAVVVSGSPIASRVGRDILQAGGNAVDAAVAVGFALAVVHPEAGNIGGGGFMLYREAGGAVYALDYREMAPSGASRDMYLEPDGDPNDLSVTGALAAAVPGSVAGLIEAHRRFGRLPFADVINPAIALANDGFLVDEYRTESIGDEMSRLYLFPASRAQFLPGGHPPQPGTTFVQRDLGRTLELIRDKGAAGFYTGRTADLIVAEMERSGGLITHADLANYKAYWRDPILLTYRGDTIYSMPPASSGGTTMGMILNIMEGYSPCRPSARRSSCTSSRRRWPAPSWTGTPTSATRDSSTTRSSSCSPSSTPPSGGPPSTRSVPRPPRSCGPASRTAPPPRTIPSWTVRATPSASPPRSTTATAAG